MAGEVGGVLIADQLVGTYASHGGFNNLDTVPVTNIMTYMIEHVGKLPTFIEYRADYGKVLALTTPLEYYKDHFINAQWSLPEKPDGYSTTYQDLFFLMLSRSIRYMMNLEVSEDLPASADALALGLKALKAGRASH